MTGDRDDAPPERERPAERVGIDAHHPAKAFLPMNRQLDKIPGRLPKVLEHRPAADRRAAGPHLVQVGFDQATATAQRPMRQPACPPRQRRPPIWWATAEQPRQQS